MDAKQHNRTVFSRRLTQLRRNSGMTQKKIAQSLSIDRSTYAYYELDKTKPDFETLVRISNIYQVSVDYLLGQTDSPGIGSVVRVQEPTLSYGDLSDDPTPLSYLTEDEQSFLIMFRQMDDQQRQNLLEYALECLRYQFDAERTEK